MFLNPPRDKVTARLTKMLARGFSLLVAIPFLLQAIVRRFVQELWPDLSAKGLTALQVYLVLFFSAFAGVKNLNRLGDVQDLGLAVFS